ncbi:hypothetical protein [Amycolatopsis sp. H20-H5]|uniref:hypothetical protein n=1 Tax=Amycolatopsis sp. H20-H5 TaxID=3046309 RepID=UPI002DBA68E4|nr:hypothetical protein [Amycolatopsis sp. H20-H5]MEC3975195.1 hypothetical protein [Amycolatopsis sp. H20-H5]
MKTLRVLFFLPGIAALVWGVLLFADYALPLRPDSVFTLGWLVGFPVLHDAVVAPVVGVAGLLLSRVVPVAWKTPVVVGTVLTAILAILSVPLLWRTYGTPPSPGLHDGSPGTGLLVSLAVVWAVVILTGALRALLPHLRRRPHVR